MVPLPKLPVPVPAPAAPAMPARGGSAALSAIIVAGGRSSRLDGSPKALMRPPEGRELVHGAAAALLELGVPAPRIAVVGPQDLPLPDGVLRAREDPPFSGPASALAAGAAALGLSEASGASDPAEAPDPAETDDRAAAAPSHMTEAAWTLTLACDMPRIAEAARALMDRGARFIACGADLLMVKTGMERLQEEFSSLGFTFGNRLKKERARD